MSSTVVNTAILLTDTPEEVKTKINKYAFSGGGATLEEQKEKGANLDIDIPYQYLKFFLDDDDLLEDIKVKYGSGQMMTGEVKQVLIDCLQTFVRDFQTRRAQVTDEMVQEFMAVRPINPVPQKFQEQQELEKEKKKKADEEKKKMKEEEGQGQGQGKQGQEENQ